MAASRHRMPALLIVARNLRVAAHTGGPIALRAAMVAMLLLSLIFATQNRGRVSAAGRDLLVWFDYVNLWLLWLCGILLFPSVIAEEREQRTWPLLRLAGVGPASFLLGQSASMLVMALLAILVQVPFLLLAVALGGASVAMVLGSVGVLVAHAVAVYGVALLASARARSVRGAIAWALLLVPAISFLPELLDWCIGLRPLASALHHLPLRTLTVLRVQAVPAAELLTTVGVQLGLGLAAMLAAWLLFSNQDAEIEAPTRARRAARLRPRFPAGGAALRDAARRLASGGPRTWILLFGVHLLILGIVRIEPGRRSNTLIMLFLQGLVVTVVATLLGAWSMRPHLSQRTIPLLSMTHGDSTRWLTAIRHARWQTLAVLLITMCITAAVCGPSDRREINAFVFMVVGAGFLGDAVGENCALRGTRAPWAVAALVMAGVGVLMISGGFVFRPRSAVAYFSTHATIYLLVAWQIRHGVRQRWRYPK